MIGRAVLLGLQGATLAARAAVALRTRGRARHAPPPADGPIRVMFVAQYPGRFAGTKYRLGVWAARLRREGHAADLFLSMPDEHSTRLANDWSLRARAEFHLRLLRNRSATAARAGGYHVAVIHMNDLPFWDYGEPFVARALARSAGRLLLDLDDAPLAPGEATLRPRARALEAAVDGLVLGTPDLREHYASQPAWIVPTCIEPSEWPVPDRAARPGPPVVGWVGTPGNLAFLEMLAPVLAAACRRHGARVRVVSSRPPSLPDVPVDFVPWSAEREVEDLLPVDVGLAPLEAAPKQRCKCGLKALQYMATGAPTVAAPLGALARIVRDGENGFLATDREAWARALDRLLGDRDLRLRLGAAARRDVETRWSFDVHHARFVEALRGARPDFA